MMDANMHGAFKKKNSLQLIKMTYALDIATKIIFEQQILALVAMNVISAGLLKFST